MSTSDLERRLETVLHLRAEAVMTRTDTDAELDRALDRVHAGARRRRTGWTAAGLLAAAALTAVVVWLGGAAPSEPEPADGGELVLEVEDIRPRAVSPSFAPVPASVVTTTFDAPTTLRTGTADEDYFTQFDGGTGTWRLLAMSREQVDRGGGTPRLLATFHGTASEAALVEGDVIVIGVEDGGLADAGFAEWGDGYLRVDRRTGEVLGFTETGYAGRSIDVVGSDVWVPTGFTEIGVLDTGTGQITRRLPTPEPVEGVDAAGGLLWTWHFVSNPATIVALDPTTGEVVARVEVDGTERDVSGILATEDALLLSLIEDEQAVLARLGLDGSTSALAVTVPAGTTRPVGAVSYEADGVATWNLGGGRALLVDVATLATGAGYTVPDPGSPERMGWYGDGLAWESADGLRLNQAGPLP